MSLVEHHLDAAHEPPRPRSTPLHAVPASSPDFVHDVAILGLGYVGLPTALALHAAGQSVLGVDIDAARLEAVRDERADVLPSDAARLGEALGSDRLTLSADVAQIATAAHVVICVPTPVDHFQVPDLSILRAACATVVEHAVAGQVVILTSTTYVGSTFDMLAGPLAARGLVAGSDVFVAFSPERIDPGNAGHAHEDVPRVVGGVTGACARRAAAQLERGTKLVHVVSSPEAAEMTKLLENTFRAVNIAMVNEFADASRGLDLDIMEVIAAASTKPYGFMPFTPGPGVGGHCIPCDPHYLLWQLRRDRVSMPLVEQAMAGIASRPQHVLARAREVLSDAGKPLAGARVLLLGMAYKPDVEDLRESPALEIADRLIAAGAEVRYHDSFIDSVRLGDRTLTSWSEPEPTWADLVLVHTLHSDLDLDLVHGAVLVLDATYRVGSGPQVSTL